MSELIFSWLYGLIGLMVIVLGVLEIIKFILRNK